jgi:hypothetical protein
VTGGALTASAAERFDGKAGVFQNLHEAGSFPTLQLMPGSVPIDGIDYTHIPALGAICTYVNITGYNTSIW